LNDSAAEESGIRATSELPPRLAEFERVYRGQLGAVAAFFARRSSEPQLVADLTADTFVAAIRSFNDPRSRRPSDRAWTIGIARQVYARHRESDPRDSVAPGPASARRLLDRNETRELTYWIDVEQSSRELIERLSSMSALDREAVELVDLCELTPAEAARVLGIPTGALRVRLVRARARLRREGGERV
jgi:RNA polymerase sigma-70 factor (ECF subfamily)